jgi:hypothetical protein
MIRMILIRVCMTSTTVRNFLVAAFIVLRFSSRRYRYHTCGLVPLSFDEFSPDPVGSTASAKHDADSFSSRFSSTLINGKGRYPDGPSVPLAFVNVQQGKRSVLPLISRVIILTCIGLTATGSACCLSLAILVSSFPSTATK